MYCFDLFWGRKHYGAWIHVVQKYSWNVVICHGADPVIGGSRYIDLSALGSSPSAQVFEAAIVRISDGEGGVGKQTSKLDIFLSTTNGTSQSIYILNEKKCLWQLLRLYEWLHINPSHRNNIHRGILFNNTTFSKRALKNDTNMDFKIAAGPVLPSQRSLT